MVLFLFPICVPILFQVLVLSFYITTFVFHVNFFIPTYIYTKIICAPPASPAHTHSSESQHVLQQRNQVKLPKASRSSSISTAVFSKRRNRNLRDKKQNKCTNKQLVDDISFTKSSWRVRFVFLEYGALDICKSSVCARSWTLPTAHFLKLLIERA